MESKMKPSDFIAGLIQFFILIGIICICCGIAWNWFMSPIFALPALDFQGILGFAFTIFLIGILISLLRGDKKVLNIISKE